MSWSSSGEQEQPGEDTEFLRSDGTVVTIGAGGELGWDKGGETGAATTSEGSRVFSLFLSHQLYEHTQKIIRFLPFPADSGTGQQPPTTASYSIKTGAAFNNSKHLC